MWVLSEYLGMKVMSIFTLPLQPVALHTGKYEWAGRPQLGDCSFRIQEVDIRFDDGEWTCQVTSSDYQTQDALSSDIARLVVRGMKSYLFGYLPPNLDPYQVGYKVKNF